MQIKCDYLLCLIILHGYKLITVSSPGYRRDFHVKTWNNGLPRMELRTKQESRVVDKENTIKLKDQ